jgi:transcriptional regulator with XRE-family HTH domain
MSAMQVYEFRRDDATASYEYRSLPTRTKSTSTVFGRRLREARLRAGIPQDRLGVAIGLDESTASTRISRYETGVHATPFDTAVLLAHALDVPTPYLYCEDDELAALVLSWGGLSKGERRRVRLFIDELESTSKGPR